MTIAPQPWAEHLERLDWARGEHVLIAGPTGTGKTTIAAQLVERRSHVMTFATKLTDPTLDREYRGWDRVRDVSEIRSWMSRVIVQARPPKRAGRGMLALRAAQRDVFPRALDWVYQNGGWCVLVDETLYMADPKYGNVGSQIEMMHYHGRSMGISMVTLTQRPAWIPKIIYSSASHAYIAKTRDAQDLKRLAELAGTDPDELRRAVSMLPTRFDWVYTPSLGEGTPAIVNTRR